MKSELGAIYHTLYYVSLWLLQKKKKIIAKKYIIQNGSLRQRDSVRLVGYKVFPVVGWAQIRCAMRLFMSWVRNL